MTIKEVNEMRMKGLKNYEKEKLLDAYTIVNATKNTFADLEKDIKAELEKQMVVGDQLSLDFGSNTFTSTMVELDEIGHLWLFAGGVGREGLLSLGQKLAHNSSPNRMATELAWASSPSTCAKETM